MPDNRTPKEREADWIGAGFAIGLLLAIAIMFLLIVLNPD